MSAPVTDLPGLLHLGAVDLGLTSRHATSDVVEAARILREADVSDPLATLRRIAEVPVGNIAWTAGELVTLLNAYRAQQRRVSAAHRIAWSGPTRAERQWSGAAHWRKEPSALNAGYHRRYRNRQGRR